MRLVDGLNMMLTRKGNIIKRTGSVRFSPNYTLGGSIDHMEYCETLDQVPTRAVISTWYDGTSYKLSSVITTPTPTQSAIPYLRGTENSTKPHEMVSSRGRLYIKGFASSNANDPLQSMSYNPGNATTAFWGLVGPTVPSAVSAGAASTYNFTVNFGWYYVYTWKTSTGQESNRSPLQQDQSKVSSSTGAIANFCPSVVVQGYSDTTNVPTICIYRSTDGGGNFYKLEEITNTGSGSITYVDRNFPDGLTTPSQPYPDSALDTTKISPTLVSNSPPPTVISQDIAFATLNGAITNSATSLIVNSTFSGVPTNIAGYPIASVPLNYTITIDQEQMIVTATGLTMAVTRGANGTVAKSHASGASVRYTPITGIDPPQKCTGMANYSGRIWYGISNILFYSGNEEISAGVPEECWPSGLNGNFYRFSSPICGLVATSEALYVICTDGISWIKGTTKDSFQVLPLFTDIGGSVDQPRAYCSADKSVIFLTNDYRICIMRGYNRDFISDPLSSYISARTIAGTFKVHMVRHAEEEKDLLVVLIATNGLSVSNQWNPFNPSGGVVRQLVYDFNQSDKGMWNVPWAMPITAAISSYIDIGSGLSKNLILASAIQNGSFVNATTTYWDANSDWTGANSEYPCFFTVSLVRNPTGNHVNMLREPGMVSVLHAIKIDRTSTPGDTDPVVTYYLDNSTGADGAVSTNAEYPPRRIQSIGYDTTWYMVNEACERVSVKISKEASSEVLEVQSIAFVFSPDSGA